MKRNYQFFIAILVLMSLVNCSKSDSSPVLPSYLKTTVQYKQVNGVDANLLSLDIYHFGESSTEKPVIIYVHGGAFAIGDKANSMTNKQNLFSSLSYILVSVNYRLSPSTYSTDPNRIKVASASPICVSNTSTNTRLCSQGLIWQIKKHFLPLV